MVMWVQRLYSELTGDAVMSELVFAGLVYSIGSVRLLQQALFAARRCDVGGRVLTCFRMDISLLNWNVRGLNNPARRRAVQNRVRDLGCNIICLQETKIADFSRALITETLGPRFYDNFIFKPADGTCGGILMLVPTTSPSHQSPQCMGSSLSLSVVMTDKSDGSAWAFTGVYGPQDDPDKVAFMQELRSIKMGVQNDWLIAGDFNLIAKASDKSNDNINIHMMGRFRSVIEHLELKEFQLVGRRYTWASEGRNNTSSKLDRVLVTKEWELRFPSTILCRRPRPSLTIAPYC